MIEIREIGADGTDAFWKEHIKYLVDDGIISDDEDIKYFSSDEYRGVIENHMRREPDTHRLVYFVRDGRRIGACSYCTYKSEDFKCFILDFWVFPEFRGNGTGRECFSALERYTKADGAVYYEINSSKPNSIRFWLSNGFVPNGVNEYGEKKFIKK